MPVQKLTIAEFCKTISDIERHPTSFELLSTTPVLVDFYTSWCSYCRTLSPILEEMQEKFKNQVAFYKVNLEEEPLFEQIFNLHTVPTLLFARPGAKPVLLLGTMNRAELTEKIHSLLLPQP